MSLLRKRPTTRESRTCPSDPAGLPEPRVHRPVGGDRFRSAPLLDWNIALRSAGESAAGLDLVEIECGATPDQLLLARGHLRVATLRTLGLAR